MLRKIDKNIGINASEEKLINLADNAFLGLWSYANVYSDEGYSKNKIGKEVCDLLVVFGDDVLIFSDKSIKFNEDKDVKVAWKRWFKRSVSDSCNQLFGAEKFIKENPQRLFVDKECKTKFPVEINSSARFHLIAVTDNIAGPLKKYFDSIVSGSSSTLVNTFIYDEKECLECPFCVGDLYPEKTFVHVLDETSLSLLLTELNTANDFISYLKAKERAVREQNLILSLGEEETLACYLNGNRKIITDEIIRTGQLVSLPEGEWKQYTKSFHYQHALSIRKGSVFWDNLINTFSDSILAANVGYFGDEPFSKHEAGVREIAKESREARYYLSKSFKDKIDAVPPHITSSRLVESPDEEGKFYLFLFVPNNKNEEYLVYRRRRIALINFYTPIALAKHKNIKKIIAIATEPKHSSGRSEDLIYTLLLNPLSRNERAELQKVARETKIMSDYIPWKKPESTSHRTPDNPFQPKIGRNAPCFCGSGIKYKKCHG